MALCRGAPLRGGTVAEAQAHVAEADGRDLQAAAAEIRSAATPLMKPAMART